jgi:hypothetical protein
MGWVDERGKAEVTKLLSGFGEGKKAHSMPQLICKEWVVYRNQWTISEL